tara:strand:- start:428 stop:577 length:150 start_codon:yes stop_codon:yes gene_type:complete
MPEMPTLKTLLEVPKFMLSVIFIFDLILVIKVYIFKCNKNKNDNLPAEL